MGPEQMQPEQAAQEGGDDIGAITALAKQTGDGLVKLSEALNNSPAATDEDRAQMQSVLSGFIDLVEKKLGAAPGEDPAPEEGPAVDAAVPATGGRTGVPMGPNTRM